MVAQPRRSHPNERTSRDQEHTKGRQNGRVVEAQCSLQPIGVIRRVSTNQNELSLMSVYVSATFFGEGGPALEYVTPYRLSGQIFDPSQDGAHVSLADAEYRRLYGYGSPLPVGDPDISW